MLWGMFVRAVCGLVNVLLGDSEVSLSADEAARIKLARGGDAYFGAFRQHCLAWVYPSAPSAA